LQLNLLLKIAPTTIIDSHWLCDLAIDRPEVIHEMLAFSSLQTAIQLLEKYERYTIKEFIDHNNK